MVVAVLRHRMLHTAQVSQCKRVSDENHGQVDAAKGDASDVGAEAAHAGPALPVDVGMDRGGGMHASSRTCGSTGLP